MPRMSQLSPLQRLQRRRQLRPPPTTTTTTNRLRPVEATSRVTMTMPMTTTSLRATMRSRRRRPSGRPSAKAQKPQAATSCPRCLRDVRTERRRRGCWNISTRQIAISPGVFFVAIRYSGTWDECVTEGQKMSDQAWEDDQTNGPRRAPTNPKQIRLCGLTSLWRSSQRLRRWSRQLWKPAR